MFDTSTCISKQLSEPTETGAGHRTTAVKSALKKINVLLTLFYYIDTSVLLGNIPLVKFINATSGTRVVYFP